METHPHPTTNGSHLNTFAPNSPRAILLLEGIYDR